MTARALARGEVAEAVRLRSVEVEAGVVVWSAPRVPRVLIDMRMVRGRLHGIARYALELARNLPTAPPGWARSCS